MNFNLHTQFNLPDIPDEDLTPCKETFIHLGEKYNMQPIEVQRMYVRNGFITMLKMLKKNAKQ